MLAFTAETPLPDEAMAAPAIPPEWRVSLAPVPYPEALAGMEQRVAAIEAGTAPELFWLLQHPPLYTKGTSAAADELHTDAPFPVYETGRGGRMTYHGPGQRVIYALCDLRQRGRDVRAHVCRLEEWVIRVLGDFGIIGERRQGRVGIWVIRDGKEQKIAAIGVRVRRWIAYHGLSFNVNPDLAHYQGIVPCGLPEFGVTSMQALGIKPSMKDVDVAFRRHHAAVFGF
ncbi:MAG TPA: lipoyl(octanoyl) transferase LipB [Alphaproteobacteria bacterium]|nr:lipoyl(octanoyl) transferase LipB [Alphaproteobacteria bacterium]